MSDVCVTSETGFFMVHVRGSWDWDLTLAELLCLLFRHVGFDCTVLETELGSFRHDSLEVVLEKEKIGQVSVLVSKYDACAQEPHFTPNFCATVQADQPR